MGVAISKWKAFSTGKAARGGGVKPHYFVCEPDS
jgi:hypothetical protein